MINNLALWNTVFKTDPDQTKPITGKPYKGTSPKPYYLIQRATEVFGPCGIGWGFKILNERIEDGATGDKVHIAHICVWYVQDGQRGEVEHVGETMFAGKNKNGPYTDEDAPKKSVTDALVKALSLIGFAGDIFMGRFDDSKYVSEVRQEIAEEKRNAPDESAVIYANKVIERIAEAVDTIELKDYWAKQASTREAVGVINGHPEYRRMFEALTARGKALSAKTVIRSDGARVDA